MDIDEKIFKKYYTGLPSVKEIADKCGFTLGELADRCGVSLRTVMYWNSGGGLGLNFKARVILREVYDLYRRN